MEQLTAVGRWKLDKTLGQGSYGVVKRANHAHTHAQAAIKIVDTTKLKKPSERVALRREVSVHYTLKHQNVVEVLEVFERSGYIFIVMELLEGGDLFNYIVEHGKLEEDRARHLFIQMLNALWYCHANSVVHRDLKLENFLIDKEAATVKLTDFGFCNIMSKDRLLETFCGSPYYCAPEIFLAQKYEGKSADIWSLGVILYAILTGSLPFVNPQGKVMFDKLMVAECPYPAHLSENSKSLIRKMLQPTPANRAPITELLTHPWLSGPIPASVPTRPRTSSLFTPPTCAPSPREAYHSVAETRPRRGQQNNKNNRKSVVGTWKRVTDMLALQFFSKKDDKDKDKDRKDSCSADDWVPMSPTITSIATNTSSTNSSSSANSSTGSSTSAGSAGAIKATVRAC